MREAPSGSLVVDLGATKVASVVSSRIRTSALPVLPRATDELAWLAAWIAEELTPAIHRIVVAAAPEMDARGVVRRWPNRPEWLGLPLGTALAFNGVSVEILADGAAAALGEASEQGLERMLYLGLGTGVSTGWVVDGMPVPVREPIDLAHTTIADRSAECVCGRRGCVQAWASGRGIMDRIVGLGLGDLSWNDIARRWSGPALAHVRRGAVDALSAASRVGAEMFGCEVVVIGGRLVGLLPGLVADVRYSLGDGTLVRMGRLGGDATLHGAVALARVLDQPLRPR
ncbi:ROK family protein [Nocardioides zeae]|uniref:ROK family protein n=1 Tax=Nocardioides zeae TaxID=1457234 RepID=UPI0030842C87